MSRGKITTASLSDLKKMDLDAYDVKLFIVRHPGKAMDSLSKYGFVHVPELSPTSDIFAKAQEEKMTNPGEWYLNLEQGLLGMADIMLPYIRRIEEHLESGKNVLLVCYCKNESTCHRGFVKNVVEIRHSLKDLEVKE